VLLYVFLVGTPLLGLAAILHHGRRLQAPPSIGGAWRVETVAAAGGAGDCAALAPGAVVDVSQSGRYVTVTAGRAASTVVAPARLDAGALRGTVSGASACPVLAGATLEATVDRSTTPHRMSARLDGGASVAFLATRLPAETRRGGKGH
jgi:hypothetical protein